MIARGKTHKGPVGKEGKGADHPLQDFLVVFAVLSRKQRFHYGMSVDGRAIRSTRCHGGKGTCRIDDLCILGHFVPGDAPGITGTVKEFPRFQYGETHLHRVVELPENGFLLVFPTAREYTTVSPGRRSTTLFQIYQEYKEWGRVLGISSVGQLNRLTETSTVKDFIRVNETLHEKKIGTIADAVDAAGEKEKIVLIAGPSSSGKTTFTKKLAVHLQAIGLTPIMISLDDYFVPRDKTPRDEEGNYDFESIDAIDITQLNQHLTRLFDGEEVEIPFFNFKTGLPEYRGRKIKLPPRGVLLMEGIHGLNDALTPRISPERKFRIYVSALTQLNLDDHNRISTTDNRLIRRMVRDHQFRGHSATATLGMWPSVRRGEDKYIFPFQDSADATFNTALDYELGVLRNYAEPLLRQVKPWHDVFHEAVRLQTFLRNFSTIPEKLVPSESILREFIGDSGFHY